MSDERDPDEPTEDERQLLAALDRALPSDRMPAGMTQRADALVSMLDLDRDLAALLEAPDPELVGMRGGAALSEALRFEVGDGAIAVEVTIERKALSGTVLRGDLTEVVLEGSAGDLHTSSVDAFGQFEFPATTEHILRLRLVTTSARSVTTDWFLP